MNSFYEHKEIHKYTWSARNSQSIIDYFITNEKGAKLFLNVRTCRGHEIDTDHYLVKAKLKIPT
jgi:hypothetical protein